jgi:hypothetical protein
MYNDSPVFVASQDLVCNHPLKHYLTANVVCHAAEAKAGLHEDAL